MERRIPFAIISFEPETTDDGALTCVSKHSKNYGCSRIISYDGDNMILWADWDFTIKKKDILIFNSYGGEKQFRIRSYKQEPIDPKSYYPDKKIRPFITFKKIKRAFSLLKKQGLTDGSK